MKPGLFITLEGGEGTGKSTQIKRLSEILTNKGHAVVTTREPGGTPEAEKIRELLVRRDSGAWSPMAEALLLFAGRVMHVDTLIKPSVALGKIVISDRFTDSTRAYQAYGHGHPLETIESLNTLTLGDFKPDLTFIFDMPVEIGLERANHRIFHALKMPMKDAKPHLEKEYKTADAPEDKFERLGLEFHERMRQGYLEIAKGDPDRCVIIDATQSLDDVTADLQRHILGRLG
ncbi:MAG: tmk [Micavibrio sp.]|nr:tmk [Micavibrio sp.]